MGLLGHHVRRVLGARRECAVSVVVGVGAGTGQRNSNDKAIHEALSDINTTPHLSLSFATNFCGHSLNGRNCDDGGQRLLR